MRRISVGWVTIGVAMILMASRPYNAFASCGAPANPIEAENCLAGSPASQWDTAGNDDPSIQGFTTDISVNKGSTIHFKINASTATAYTITIFRIGYYGGNGARKITSFSPSVPLPQVQPACLNVPATGLNDCGNWAESASWVVPSTATSGFYIAYLKRPDNGAINFIPFVVRDDSSHSAIAFKTSDTTWQAYNNYAGNSLYVGNPAGRAYKVSFNRPIIYNNNYFLVFSWEIPAIRWLEANGYDVSYISSVDADRAGSLLTNHHAFISAGHDEYWSGPERNNVEAARSAGVHLLFWSGNESFWKIRWENSIDGTSTPYRTQVCYKETYDDPNRTDPSDPPTWTGSWRDPQGASPDDAGRPENAMTGTLFTTEERDDTMTVPGAMGKLRFWRNTSVATLSSTTVASFPEMLGYEYDTESDNGFRPAGLIHLSSTTTSVPNVLIDAGGTYAPGLARHYLTLYRSSSGAIVFGTGSIQWSWGLDSHHQDGSTPADVRLQQAMVNLFADMRIQPATRQSGLVAASASTDTTPPTSTITFPTSGTNVPLGSSVTVQGTATDSGGGVVAGIEISLDGGTSWHAANGTTNWNYTWKPSTSGSITLKSRATDDSLNTETPSAGVKFTVLHSTTPTAYSIWSPNAGPAVGDSSNDPNPIEIGVKFRSDISGTITGLRFYKQSFNTGTHIGRLWLEGGTLLAQVTYSSETASGWQTVNLSTPVAISSNTTYVASYHSATGYAVTTGTFLTSGVDNPPLHALANTIDPNGVYVYAASSTYPNASTNASNYWVDVVLTSTASLSSPPVLTGISPSSATVGSSSFTLTLSGSNFISSSTVQWNASARATTFVSSSTLRATIPASDLVSSGTFNITVLNPAPGGGTSAVSTFTVISPNPVPVLAAISPSSVTVDSSSFTLTLTGTNFISSSTVQWNGSARSTTYISSASLTALIAASDLVSSGTASVTVFNPPPGGGISNALNFVVYVSSGNVQFSTTTIFGNTAPTDGWKDPSPLEVGVKFRSDVNGFITGLRFYKGSFNTGAHTGNLWTSSGTLLAQAIYTGETASGWQQVTLSSPVAIVANTTYVASYFTTTGYSVNSSYFTSAVNNPPLHGLQNGTDGGNGVYLYSAVSAFPNQSTNSSNYWVDLMFTTSSSSGTSSNPVPTLASIAPSSATVGGSSFTLTLNGSNFISSSTVLWNGAARTTTFLSSATIKAAILASDMVSTGTAAVTIFNPAPGGGTSSAQTFTVQAATVTLNPPPTLASIAPSSATVGGSSFTLTLNGSNFISSSTVRWNGSSRTTLFISSNILTAAIPASDLASTGTATVTVFNPAPGGGTSSAQTFTVQAATVTLNPTPTLASIAPSSATVGGSSFTLTLNGSSFISSSTVEWNGSPRTTTFVNNGLLTASIPASDIISTGTTNITVFNPAPGGGTSAAKVFTVALAPNSAPDLTSISPSSATAGGSAFTLALTGSNFISGSIVQWNGSARATTWISSTSLTGAIGTADIASAGTATVTVFNPTPGGGTSSSQTFTIVASTGSTAGPFTIWSSTVVPADGYKDPSSLEVGVRFRSDINGYITGIRFYKGSFNTGTHIGNLWTNIGSLLASATFTGETASGWQTVYFSTPVAVTANTTYVASYFTTTGYSVNTKYFTVGVDNAPLHALQSGVDGLNGIYLYSAASAFPTQSTNTSNYWVDVVFNTTPTPPSGSSRFLPPQTNADAAVFTDLNQGRVYPNPWRSDRGYHPYITFDQLPVNSTVKIFTVSAHWVKTLDAPTGSVQWDLKNDSGESVASGFYIYLISNDQGGKKHGTLAIIR